MTVFELAIREWIAVAQPDLHGVEGTRPGRPGRVPPHPPFARFVVSSDSVRYLHESTGLDCVTVRYWQRRALVRVDIFADDAVDRVRRLLDYTRTADSLQRLDAAGVSFASSPSIGPHLTSEQRSQLELVFIYREQYSSLVDVVDVVEVTIQEGA